ncbi:amidase [Microbacterium sp.]|uniref:amidase n=1 Tax=Microbacterium sp. TaxID=51671 RepID=UPI00261EDAD7|nr:amidase [Microbacterium sp.]
MHYSDIGELSEALRTQELSAVEVCEHILDRIAEHDPELHSYVEVDTEGARRAAAVAEQEIANGGWRGPLHGVPLAVKDLYGTGEAPTSFGSAHLADHRLDAESEAVRRLREAGATIVGRLRMSEAALTDHGPGLPTPVNPWDKDTWVGTSSSGCASSTSAGLNFASLGSDTGGSIRGPATATGLSGLKPTRGVVSSEGALPLSRTLDTVGSFARSARDCRIVFDAISHTQGSPHDREELDVAEASSRRIGIDRGLLASVDPEIRTMIERTADVFSRLGAEIVDVEVPDGAPLASRWVAFVGFEAVTDLSGLYPQDKRELYGPEIAYVLEQGRALSPSDYAQIGDEARIYTRALDRVLEDVDALLLPTIGAPSPTVTQIEEMRRDYATWNQQVMRLTCPYNFSGHPAMTFPTGFTARATPLGAQLVAGHYRERLLLSLAEQYQSITDHHLRRPPRHP